LVQPACNHGDPAARSQQRPWGFLCHSRVHKAGGGSRSAARRRSSALHSKTIRSGGRGWLAPNRLLSLRLERPATPRRDSANMTYGSPGSSVTHVHARAHDQPAIVGDQNVNHHPCRHYRRRQSHPRAPLLSSSPPTGPLATISSGTSASNMARIWFPAMMSSGRRRRT
jgi:hypothetical protein